MRSEDWGITVRADERGPPKIMVWVGWIHEGVVRGQGGRSSRWPKYVYRTGSDPTRIPRLTYTSEKGLTPGFRVYRGEGSRLGYVSCASDRQEH